jgi:hypothetical protein
MIQPLHDNEPGDVVIPLSKTKLVLAILGSAAFVAAGVWMWWFADVQSRFDSIVLKAVGAASIGFFGLCGLYACVKIFDRRPGLIIDDDGFIDRSSAAALGRIWWDDVLGIRIASIHRQRMAVVDVADPQRLIEGAGPIARKLHAANIVPLPVMLAGLAA